MEDLGVFYFYYFLLFPLGLFSEQSYKLQAGFRAAVSEPGNTSSN